MITRKYSDSFAVKKSFLLTIMLDRFYITIGYSLIK